MYKAIVLLIAAAIMVFLSSRLLQPYAPLGDIRNDDNDDWTFLWSKQQFRICSSNHVPLIIIHVWCMLSIGGQVKHIFTGASIFLVYSLWSGVNHAVFCSVQA